MAEEKRSFWDELHQTRPKNHTQEQPESKSSKKEAKKESNKKSRPTKKK